MRPEASRHFRNKKKEYLKRKFEELETNSKIKNIRDFCRGISDFKKGYQPRTNIVKDEKGDLDADCHNIWARCGKPFLSAIEYIYMGLMMLGKRNYTQQKHWCLSQVP